MQIAALLAVLFTAAAAADGVHDGATKTAPSADEEDFLDVRQLVKNSIYALTQLPKTSSDYNKTAEDLMRLLQLPADIILTGSAPADPTTTPQSARSRSDADASPFRQLSSWEEEENAQREEEKKKAELQKRIEAETRLLEEVRRKAEAQRKIADAARKRILESGGMMPETADTTTTTTTTTTEKPPPTAAPGPRSRARPTFLDDLKALQKFFGTPVSASSPLSSVLSSSSAPSVLPAISRGLPTPQYAYQPIVQPDGRTYYQQVLIVPSSMPFPAPDLANTSSVVDSRTLDPAIPEAKKSAVNYSAELKTDDHKTLQKKHSKRFRTYSSKTVHASPSSAQSPEKAEAEEDGPAEKEAFKMVSKNGSELITTKLPSADEQRKAAEIFGEEARHPQASTAPSAAKSPVYLSSSVFHVQKEKKLRKKLKRKNPMKSNGQDDDSSPPVKRRRSWRREIHRSKSAEKTTTTETPSTSSSASSGVDAMEDTLPERKMGHSLRKMRRLRIRHRPESAEARIPRPSPNDDDDDDVSRAADAIERELVQATREAQKSSRRRRKKLRKKHRKSRTTHMSTMRIDDVKISAQADPQIRRQPPIASVAMPTFNEVFKQMEEQDARPVSVEDSSRRLESIEQRLKSAKAISKRKVVPRKGVPVTEPPSLDDFLQAAGDEAAMLGEDLSREVDRILHEGRVRRNKGHWVLDEAAAQTQPPQKAPSSSSASAETLLARKKRKRRTRRMKKYIPKYLTTPQTPTTTTTTTTTTTPTTTTTTSTAGQEEIESGISPNELVNIETSFPSDIRVTRKHCWNIRSFAWQHGMTDVTDYALSNCGYIENYYPDLPCSRAEEYMVYCRQYYKEV